MTATTEKKCQFMTIREASAESGIPEGTLRYYRHAGTGPPSFLLGGRVMYRRSEFFAWIDEQEAATRRGGAVRS